MALDISGFSRDRNIDQLLAHRTRFFHAVEDTVLFATAYDREAVKVHFLGDELRLAFRVNDFIASDLRDFVEEIFDKLKTINTGVHEDYQTKIKGVVFQGVVIWKRWHGAEFLNGPLPFKAQAWMQYLAPSEVAINESYRNSLQSSGIPTVSLVTRDFCGDLGYLLLWL